MSTPSDRLLAKWSLLKTLDEKNEISRLRLRADIAECIRDCYHSGMTRGDVAKLLEVTPPRVTRLVQGNYRATEASVRRNPENYRLTYVEVEPKVIYIERPEDPPGPPIKKECKYCGKPAQYRVEWEDKIILVCKYHKPPEVESG